LIKEKTVYENVALPLIVKGERPSFIKDKVHAVLGEVGLLEKMDSMPEFLSGGEQQRTSIARAIIHDPTVLIADEPTGNLDIQLAEEIMNLFERICKEGTTVFVASHDLAMVQRRKHRIVRINKGEITEARSTDPRISETKNISGNVESTKSEAQNLKQTLATKAIK
jgi:cell division transport system ATP-binding protein